MNTATGTGGGGGIDSTPTNAMKFQVVGELLIGLLVKHVIEEVFKDSPGYYSRFFLVPQEDSNKWSAILGLSQLKRSVGKQKFKTETAENI